MKPILGHTTALAWYRLAARPAPLACAPETPCCLSTKQTLPHEFQLAFQALKAQGLSEVEQHLFHIVVSDTQSRSRGGFVQSHVQQGYVPVGFLQEYEHFWIPDIRLIALQMARYLSLLELVELYYELCADYSLSVSPKERYFERPSLTTVEALCDYAHHTDIHGGKKKALQALKYVHNHARSPMETACAMLISLPKRLGGLGIRDIELNARIDVPSHLQQLTRSKYFLADILLKKSGTDFEYHGSMHEEEQRGISDEERRQTLQSLGFEVVVARKQSLFNQQAFVRLFEALRMQAGERADRYPADFAIRQEKLRQFVLRHYL
ncbi:hypothetical protein KPC83_05815 [Collinsella sp. zg1085]|uniref:hypothetical protein n=1 Tax=Collinsella sp. zg1085 TaxID=2844380 RepID=UPI001C0D2DC0|nr:hypothetical protein [Collinsella sp. zg1085]QWT17355.1 hypothetical protein KPC83_05815 [Collinsella sp. zg1085]